MKQTAVEWLIEKIKSKADNLPTNTKENRMAKGIYVDCLIMGKEAKEMEKQQQGYSEEEVLKLILASSKLPFANDEERIEWFKQIKKK